MCRMIGITNFSYKKHEKILEDFVNLARDGNIPPKNAPGHLDGWGIGYYNNGKAEALKSGGSILEERNVFLGKLKKIGRTGILIAHMRKSSWKGTSSAANSHPFKFDKYILAHNGTIFDYKTFLNLIPEKYRPGRAALDSEVLFRFLIDPFKKEAKGGLEKAMNYLIKNGDYSSLTNTFSDGLTLFAFREYKRLPKYYTLYYAGLNGSVIVCSEKISGKLKWISAGKKRLLAF
jgi:predicted glutamine amidotransferase